METYKKLLHLRRSLGLTQEEFGKRLGVSNQFISQVESGKRNVGLRFLKKVADTFGVKITDLIGEDEEFVVTEDDESFIRKFLKLLTPEEKEKVLKTIYRIKKIPLREIPVLGYVQAGEPLELTDMSEPLEELTVPASPETKRALFAVIVHGDSMKDKGIEEGDYLLIDPNSPVESGEFTVAVIDNKATFKILRREGNKVYLEPANKHYERIELTPDMDVRLFRVLMVIKKKEAH